MTVSSHCSAVSSQSSKTWWIWSPNQKCGTVSLPASPPASYLLSSVQGLTVSPLPSIYAVGDSSSTLPAGSVVHHLLPRSTYILSGCPEALNQGRLTWRHDSVLQQIVKGVTKFLDKGEKVFADLPNLLATSSPPSTIPPELCSTSCRPDLVVWSPDTDEIRILELTVCHNSISFIESAKKCKQEKQPYSELTSDLEMAGHTVFYDTIEIGSLGHYLKSSMQALASTIPNSRRQDLTKLITSLAKTAIGCSATIFHVRNSFIWEKSKPLYTPLF